MQRRPTTFGAAFFPILVLTMLAVRTAVAAIDELNEIQVTAERLGLMGAASTAGEGVVVNDELALTPAYRVAQLLETVPGLQVTSHTGEGLTTRADFNDVSRYPTKDRVVIPAIDNPLNFSEADSVRLTSVAAFTQATTHWTEWFRIVLGYRYDTQYGSDVGTNAGTASGHLLAPKGSLIFRPAEATEIYFSAGRGFHSDDLRGVTAAQNAALSGAPLIARQSGEEIGLRQEFTHAFTMTLAFYALRADSETTYDPDAGVDSAGPGSRRRGYEINLTYQAL